MDLENKKGINIEEINGVKNNLYLSPIEAKADLTETINNTYNDVVQPIVQKVGKELAFCFEFLTSKIKPYMYEKIQEAKYKCVEIDKKLEEKYNKIPEQNKTMPRTCIIGPSLDVLKYNLDEEHIKEIFINILTNEMDTRKQSKILPAYINIVNQLSKEDALFLKKLHSYLIYGNNLPIIRMKKDVKNDAYNFLDSFYNYDILNPKPELANKIILTNLERMGIIEITFLNNISSDKIYTSIINYALSYYNDNTLKYDKGIIQITEFGENFIDICLS